MGTSLQPVDMLVPARTSMRMFRVSAVLLCCLLTRNEAWLSVFTTTMIWMLLDSWLCRICALLFISLVATTAMVLAAVRFDSGR